MVLSTETTKPGLTNLRRIELETLYGVGEILSRTLDFRHTLREVLRALDELAGMSRSLVTVVDPESGDLVVHAVSIEEDGAHGDIRYHPGEGLLGLILEEKQTIALARTGDEPRFLNRLGIFDRRLPFIAVPVNVAGKLQGVLAVQPNTPDDGLLEERTRFVEMVANLIGHSVRLSLDIEREKKTLVEERDSLRRTVRHQYGFDNIVGRSSAMRRVFDQVRMVSKWNTTVLLRGETGTGKELIANAIHYHSPRASGPYVRLNCASLPENLLESELFGHEKGAFTGALAAQPGKFELADGGTLLLDEISEMPLALQAKLLRVLQEREVERVGGRKPIPLDIRIIATSNRDLAAEVRAGRFREDLFYRLSVFPLAWPPLRERPADILPLAEALLQRHAAKMKRSGLRLSAAARASLLAHAWPGNVRELDNALQRALILCSGSVIEPADLCLEPGRPLPVAAPAALPAAVETEEGGLGSDLRRHEFQMILDALRAERGRRKEAAERLGISPRTLRYKLAQMRDAGLDVETAG